MSITAEQTDFIGRTVAEIYDLLAEKRTAPMPDIRDEELRLECARIAGGDVMGAKRLYDFVKAEVSPRSSVVSDFLSGVTTALDAAILRSQEAETRNV
jgi:hypothetical protein